MVDVDAQRERNAAKQRAYRARKAAEREAARSAVAGDVGNGVASTTMRDSVESSLAAAKWLTGSDAASMAQARVLAARIDLLEHADETARALSAHRALSQILNDLGATASKRLQYELRSRKMTPPEGDDGEQPTEAQGANVTKFQRPAKRAR